MAGRGGGQRLRGADGGRWQGGVAESGGWTSHAIITGFPHPPPPPPPVNDLTVEVKF